MQKRRPGSLLIKVLLLLFGWELVIILFCVFAVALIFGPLYLIGGPGEIGNRVNNGSWSGAEWSALENIPEHLLPYFKAAGKEYNISWWVLAAIAEVESNFRAGVIGPPNYTGELARGMMQFLPSTWEKYGIDGDGDGKADIYNQIDNIYSAANYLAANNGASDIKGALFIYNHSEEYVEKVLAVAEGYRIQNVWKTKGVGFPLLTNNPRYTSYFGESRGGRAHRGVDIACDYGTPLLAVADGVIRHSHSYNGGNELWIETSNGIKYFYCHLSKYVTRPGQKVTVGQTVALAGSSGVSTGPHLHFGIMVNGKWVNPLPFLDLN